MIFYRVPPNMEYVSFGEGVVSNHQCHKRPPLFSYESHPNGIDPHFHYRCTCRWQSGTSHKVAALHNLIRGSQQTSLGKTPQLNWRPQVIHKPAKQLNRLGFQESKRDKLQWVTQIKSSKENSNRCTKCKWQEHHKGAQIPLSQIPPKLQKLMGE